MLIRLSIPAEDLMPLGPSGGASTDPSTDPVQYQLSVNLPEGYPATPATINPQVIALKREQHMLLVR